MLFENLEETVEGLALGNVASSIRPFFLNIVVTAYVNKCFHHDYREIKAYIKSKAPFRLSIRNVDVTVKHYFPPSPPLRLLSFLLSSARQSAKSVNGSRGLI